MQPPRAVYPEITGLRSDSEGPSGDRKTGSLPNLSTNQLVGDPNLLAPLVLRLSNSTVAVSLSDAAQRMLLCSTIALHRSRAAAEQTEVVEQKAAGSTAARRMVLFH